MLFYTTDYNDLELIPSSYSVIAFTDTNINSGCKYVRLKQLLPIKDGKLSKEENKSNYKKLLKERKHLVAYVAKEAIDDQANSIVLYCDERDIKYYGFNFIKTLCKFINKRYNITPFKFTTTVTKEMRLSSHDKDRMGKLVDDCKKVYEGIVH